MIGMIVASYVYFVNQTILTIAQTHDLQETIGEVRSEMTSLEVAYLKKQEMFTESYAFENGFVDPQETTYVKDTTVRTAGLYGQTIQE